MIICHVHISNRNAKRERASTSRKLDSVLVAHAQTRDRTLKLRSRRDASTAQRIARSEFVVVVLGRLLFELELQRANVARWQHDEDGGGKVARAAPQVEQHQRQRA